MLLALALALIVADATAAVPIWPVLTGPEQTKFDAGALVIRADTSTEKTQSTGLVRVQAPLAVLWKAALDFPARLPENPTLRSVEEYGRNGPDDWFVKFRLSIYGISVVIHDHWICSPAETYCHFAMDPTRVSDVREEYGWLYARATPSGSEIAFHSAFISDMWAPGWIRKWLANDSMVNVLDKLRVRAERTATSTH